MRRLVIGTGLPRTGTSSVRRAMELLGYSVVAPCFDADVAADVFEHEQRLAGLAMRVETALDAGRSVYLSEPAWVYSPYMLVELFGRLMGHRAELQERAPGEPEIALLHTWRDYAPWVGSMTAYVRQRQSYDPRRIPVRSALCDVNIALYASLQQGSVMPDLLAVHARDELRWRALDTLGVPAVLLNVERPVPYKGVEDIVPGLDAGRAELDSACRWCAVLAAVGEKPAAFGNTCYRTFPHLNRGGA